jgi:predicted dehydrogenase
VLEALVDPVTERAKALASRFGIKPCIASTLREVLAGVDGVIVATPNDSHAELALESIQAGVSVLVEKPLATTLKEGEEVVHAAAKAGVTVAVGYGTRFRQNVQRMAYLMSTQYFGAVTRFGYQYGSRGGWAPLSGYNLQRRAAGGGVLVVTGSHFLDRMIYWFGYPVHASLEDDSIGGPEANAAASFRFQHGHHVIEGGARFSKTVELPEQFVAETSEGTLLLGAGANAPIWFRPNNDRSIRFEVQSRNICESHPDCDLQLNDFIDSCRNHRAPLVSAADGLLSLRLIESLYSRRAAMSTDWYATASDRGSRAACTTVTAS